MASMILALESGCSTCSDVTGQKSWALLAQRPVALPPASDEHEDCCLPRPIPNAAAVFPLHQW
jgi:hypothetical protein